MNKICKELANYIGLNSVPESWNNCIESALSTMPKNIEWLEKDFLTKAIKFYKIDNETQLKSDILITAKKIQTDKKLKLLSYLFHYILYIDKTNQIQNVWGWEHNENLFKTLNNNILPLIVLLSGYKIHMKNMKIKEFDIEQIENHIERVHESCLKDRGNLGLKGIRFSQMVWGAYFTNIRIVQIGNLEYEPFIPDEDFIEKITNLNNTFYKDNKIDVYSNNNYFIKLHIPKQKNFNIEKSLNSLKNAPAKLSEYYPNSKNKNIHYFCESWLLSEELNLFLSEKSNIIKFNNLFNICKDANSGKGYYKYLFNQANIISDLDKLPEATSLQQKVKSYLKEGKPLNDGYGLIRDEYLEM